MGRPFLKWAGNKYQNWRKIVALYPDKVDTYVEPFMGALGVGQNYFGANNYIFGDLNPDLANLYQQLANHGQDFIKFCKTFFTQANRNETNYYALRARFNDLPYNYERAAIFVYLNRHGFNGLCRYNSKGKFNVSIGRHKTIYYPEKEMFAFWRFTQTKNITWVAGDFEKTFALVPANALVYCDPPYVPWSETANFTNYAGTPFDLTQHKKLVLTIEKTVAEKNATVIISNYDLPVTRDLYKNATTIKTLKAFYSLSQKASTRGCKGELLAVFKSKGFQ